MEIFDIIVMPMARPWHVLMVGMLCRGLYSGNYCLGFVMLFLGLWFNYVNFVYVIYVKTISNTFDGWK